MWRFILMLGLVGGMCSTGYTNDKMSERRGAELRRTLELRKAHRQRRAVRAELARNLVVSMWLTWGPAYGGWGWGGGWWYPIYVGSPYHPYFGFNGVK